MDIIKYYTITHKYIHPTKGDQGWIFWSYKSTWRRPKVKFGRNVVKEETTQKLPRWGQKVRNK